MNQRDTLTIHSPAPGQPASSISSPVGLANAYRIPGYLPGLRQPAVAVDVSVNAAVSAEALQAYAETIAKALPAADKVVVHPSFQEHTVVAHVMRATQAVLWQAGLEALDPPVVLQSEGQGASLKLALPSYVAPQETLDALFWAVDLMNRMAAGLPVDEAMAALPRVAERVHRHAPSDMNTPMFLAAVRALGIPWRHLYGNLFQFGWGARARRMESTITSATSAIGLAAAKDKRATAMLLRAAGLPVPRHELAGDADRAVRIAARLGYPVVVKPAGEDGGRGVGAGLRDEASVRRAYATARELSDAVLVESFVPGNDYRVDILDGEVYGITQRIPGGVIGDGKTSITQLLEKLNADPRRGEPGSISELKRIDVDAEAQDWLARQGLGTDSIPEAGRFVRLRGAANIALGGFPVSVTDKAHPDNIALCVRAARVMGLDVAGVDLLIPDIGRSWLDSGAGICEVNGKPQLSRADLVNFFRKLLPNAGRIPVVMVLGHHDRSSLAALSDALADLGRVGTAWAEEVRVGPDIVAKATADTYHAGLALLTDPGVDVAVIGIPASGPGRAGLPVDRFDVLVLGGAPPAGTGDEAAWKRWHSLALTLAPLCRHIVRDSECSQWEAVVPKLDAKKLVSTPSSGLPEAVRRKLQALGNDATISGKDGS